MRRADGCGFTHSKYGWKDVKKVINTDDDKTVIANNKQDEYFNTGSKEDMETENNYQNKLDANKYAAFSDDNDDNWNTHVLQYVKREEKPGRMREIGKATKRHAPKEEEAIRYLPYGSLIKRMSKIGKATKRHAPKGEEDNRCIATKMNAQHRLESNTTKGNATDREETNRFSQRRFVTNRNAIKQSSFQLTIMEGEYLPTNTQPMKRRVIPTTNVGDIRNIPNKNDIPTENNEKQMHLKHADNGIKPKERMNMTRLQNTITPTRDSMTTRARAWNAIMQSDWAQETIDNHNARLYKKTWSPTRLGHQLSEYEKQGTINPQEFGSLLFDQTRLTQACADSGCTTTICIPGTPLKNVRPTRNPI